MNLSRPFILRPVATSLLMVALVLVGVVAYRQLPVSALPQVDYPTIQVLTFYPGASPEVMASSVTSPLERQFGQVPGLTQMTSSSSEGCSCIVLRFDLELDIDIATQQVQAAINSAAAVLPRDLPNKDQSRRRPHPHPRPDQRHAPADEGPGSRRHEACAEDLAAFRRGDGEHLRGTEAGDPHRG